MSKPEEASMHDIDHTLTEFEPEMEFEEEWDLNGQDVPDEYEQEYEYEYEDEAQPYTPEEAEGPLDEAEEMELAAELLGVADEAELEQLFGKIIHRVGRRIRRFVRKPLFRRVTRVLRGATRRALPMFGRAAGAYFGGPTGAYIGGQVAPRAGRIFGLELEGLSPEDQEFETARRLVRFAATTAKNAALAPPDVHPEQVAKSAAIAAAQQHAPGLLRPASTHHTSSIEEEGRSGRWVRRGRKIVLMGV
jgi:hypothetical protein